MRARSVTTNYPRMCSYCGTPISDPAYTNCPNCGGLLLGASVRLAQSSQGQHWSNAQTAPFTPAPLAPPKRAQKPPQQQQLRAGRRRGGHGWLGCVVPVVVALLLLSAASAFAIYYLINAIVLSGSSTQPGFPHLMQPIAMAASSLIFVVCAPGSGIRIHESYRHIDARR